MCDHLPSDFPHPYSQLIANIGVNGAIVQFTNAPREPNKIRSFHSVPSGMPCSALTCIAVSGLPVDHPDREGVADLAYLALA